MLNDLIVRPATDHRSPTELFFVHGAAHGAWCWEEYFLPYFANKGFNCYAINLRGQDPGRRFGRWLRIQDYVNQLSDAIVQLESCPVLVGHSLGGLVVHKYLEKASAPAAILLTPVPLSGLRKAIWRMMQKHPWKSIQSLALMRFKPLIGTPGLVRDAFFSKGIPDDHMERYFQQIADESMITLLDATLISLPRAKNVKTPVLVVGAEDDALFARTEIEELASAHGVSAHFLPNIAHDMMLERNWQTVADHIIKWLASNRDRR